MRLRLLLSLCIWLACATYVRCQGPTGTLFGVGSQSQYALFRRYRVNVVSSLAAVLGAIVAQEQLETATNTDRKVTVPTSTLANEANGCPANWYLFNGFCYFVTPTTLNWLRTRNLCMTMGGYLADIVDQAELNNLRANVLQPVDNQVLYFGLNDHIEEGNLFNDIVNEEPRFLNFAAGNGLFGPGPGDCGAMLLGTFSMVPCHQAYRGLCKRRQNSVLTYSGL